jgi:hypothetical protein
MSCVLAALAHITAIFRPVGFVWSTIRTGTPDTRTRLV